MKFSSAVIFIDEGCVTIGVEEIHIWQLVLDGPDKLIDMPLHTRTMIHSAIPNRNPAC